MSKDAEALNSSLWDYVHKLEFALTRSEQAKEKEQGVYRKKINLISQYFDKIGVQSKTLASMMEKDITGQEYKLKEEESSEPEPELEPEIDQRGNLRDEQESNEETESDDEFEIQGDTGYQNVAGLELQSVLVKPNLDKFVGELGINPVMFKSILESSGGPLQNGKIQPPAPVSTIPLDSMKSSSVRAFDSISGISNSGSVNSRGEKKKTKKKTYWKPDENLKLKELYEKYGNQWVEIQKFFPSKSTGQIRNHIRHLKKAESTSSQGTGKSKKKTTIKINMYTGELLDKSDKKKAGPGSN
ncbi:unnamed protein product [Moneuplotes crassus]|uniref:Uncharacterized protein n=1 Tax=Euplotes crassus TaxID=5936 RepID=A0AAD1XDQ3_EUPCR|nr:unnamed protein product [Moneuplotes crassus]